MLHSCIIKTVGLKETSIQYFIYKQVESVSLDLQQGFEIVLHIFSKKRNAIIQVLISNA